MEDQRKKKKKGHKQKGSGSIVSSKGDVERQGVLCKEWQRTPFHLLQEYCHAKKKRKPVYHKVDAPEFHFRMRCILKDDKNPKKDLNFCPEQHFKTMDDAKHHAALLALHFLEPARPHERKLPDPYRQIWLQLLSTSSAVADKNNSSDPKKSKKKSKKKSTKPKVQEEDSGGLNFWGEDDDAEDEDAEAEDVPNYELTSDRNFVSHAEYLQTKQAQLAARNKMNRKRENSKRANTPAQVFMSQTCRTKIESILEELGALKGPGQEERTSGDENQIFSEALKTTLLESLKQSGFKDKYMHLALQAIEKKKTLPLMQSEDELRSEILDWMCLFVPVDDLPRSFNPQGKQLDVVKQTSALSVSSAATAIMSHQQMIIVKHLMEYGFSRDDCTQAMLMPDIQSEFEVLTVLHSKLMALSDVSIEQKQHPAWSLEEMQTLRQDEIFALEAIYAENFIQKECHESQLGWWTVKSTDIDEWILHLIFDKQQHRYPFEIPMILIQMKSSSSDTTVISRTTQLYLTIELIKESQQLVGESMIFGLCSTLQTLMSTSGTSSFTTPSPRLLHSLMKPVVEEKASSTANPNERENKGKRTNSKTRSSARNTPSNRSKPQPLSAAARDKINTTLRQAQQDKGSHPKTKAKYRKIQKQRESLPAFESKAEILEAIEKHQIVIIDGKTGSGKTTQCPQYLLDHFISIGKATECNMICTQPRRIAAIGVATRVAEEQQVPLGDLVGYQVRMDSKVSKAKTRLVFCTSGILLRRLISDPELVGISHILLDEVHERSVEIDFLLLILRQLVQRRSDLRIVLMSATIDTTLFVNYFTKKPSSIVSCPVISIPGYTFPVTCHYLADVRRLTNSQEEEEELDEFEMDSENSKMKPREKKKDESYTDYAQIADLVYAVNEEDCVEFGPKHGAILIFMSGVAEIQKMIKAITQHRRSSVTHNLLLLPLHGQLSPDQQAQVFEIPPPSKRKVIVSTNLAETSVTIPDVTIVLDRGRVKEMQYDPMNRMSCLEETWTSVAASNQRKGRAGRVQSGHCFRMYSKRIERTVMKPHQAAEIHRVSLDHLCLQIKMLQLGEIHALLSQTIEPPNARSVECAIRLLTEIGALKPTTGSSCHLLTALGQHLASLSMDVRTGKFLLHSCILKCISPALTIAAAMSGNQSPFLNGLHFRDQVNETKRAFSPGHSQSDHLILLRVYEGWIKAPKKRDFCQKHALSMEKLQMISNLRQEFARDLASIGFLPPLPRREEHEETTPFNAHASDVRILKAALCAGFYSQVVKVKYPDTKYYESAHGNVEKNNAAQEIKYFIPSSAVATDDDPSSSSSSKSSVYVPDERIFIHPSSINFQASRYASPWLIFNELIKTSKVFVRETSMIAPYALLLFGGKIDIQHDKGLVVLDNWIRFQAVPLIAVLIKTIRSELDHLLQKKIKEPEWDITDSPLIEAISHLLISEGL